MTYLIYSLKHNLYIFSLISGLLNYFVESIIYPLFSAHSACVALFSLINQTTPILNQSISQSINQSVGLLLTCD